MAKKTARKIGKSAGPRRAAGQPARTGQGPAAKASAGREAQREVEQFLFRQAELLDGARWRDYIDLFAEDGIYWMPASPDQTTGEGMASIFYEDRDLMSVRMKRITHPHAWSQSPLWGTSHLVSNVTIERKDPRSGELVVRSRFHMMEFRRDASRHFAGSYLHRLRRTAGGYRIKLQRVDMVNAQGPYDYVLQAWV
ncbi:MAG: aromatic-ring-hydroxylating dioxygenase subunit beta [Pseudomonadota bacterium]